MTPATPFRVEVANATRAGSTVATLYGVARYEAGRRNQYALQPQPSREAAVRFAQRANQVYASRHNENEMQRIIAAALGDAFPGEAE